MNEPLLPKFELTKDYISRKVFIWLMALVLFVGSVLGSDGFFPGEETLITYTSKLFVETNDFFRDFCDLYVFFFRHYLLNVLVFFIVGFSEVPYLDLFKLNIFVVLNQLLKFIFAIERPFWTNSSMIGIICSNTYAGGDNAILPLILLFFCKVPGVKSRWVSILVWVSFLGYILIQVLNANIYFLTIVFDMCLIFLFYNLNFVINIFSRRHSHFFQTPDWTNSILIGFIYMATILLCTILMETEVSSALHFRHHNYLICLVKNGRIDPKSIDSGSVFFSLTGAKPTLNNAYILIHPFLIFIVENCFCSRWSIQDYANNISFKKIKRRMQISILIVFLFFFYWIDRLKWHLEEFYGVFIINSMIVATVSFLLYGLIPLICMKTLFGN